MRTSPHETVERWQDFDMLDRDELRAMLECFRLVRDYLDGLRLDGWREDAMLNLAVCGATIRQQRSESRNQLPDLYRKNEKGRSRKRPKTLILLERETQRARNHREYPCNPAAR